MIVVGDYSFFCIAAHAINDTWARYEKFIADSVISDTVLVGAEDLRAAAELGAYQLWAVERCDRALGAFLSTTSSLPGGRQMDIEFLGGDEFFTWGPLLWPYFEQNAKQQGVSTIRMCGRPGWARVFRQFGYSPDIVIAAKRL